MSEEDDIKALKALQDAQAVEYGTWRATQEIDINRVRAFNPGNPVPKSHVDSGVVSKDQVEKVASPVKTEPKG